MPTIYHVCSVFHVGYTLVWLRMQCVCVSQTPTVFVLYV